MKTLLLVLSLLFSSASYAGEFLIHTLSLHSKSSWDETNTRYVMYNNAVIRTETTITEHRYNNVNPGLGYRTDDGYLFGLYYNSYKKPTMYAAKEFMLNDSFGAFVGLGTGYEIPTGHPIMVIGGLEYKYRFNDEYALNVLALPPTGSTVGVVHIAIARSFK